MPDYCSGCTVTMQTCIRAGETWPISEPVSTDTMLGRYAGQGMNKYLQTMVCLLCYIQ